MGASAGKGRDLFKEAVAAFHAGDHRLARSLLRTASAQNANDEQVWLWRASLAETPTEAITYLREALRVNPDNEKALYWLERFHTPAVNEE